MCREDCNEQEELWGGLQSRQVGIATHPKKQYDSVAWGRHVHSYQPWVLLTVCRFRAVACDGRTSSTILPADSRI